MTRFRTRSALLLATAAFLSLQGCGGPSATTPERVDVETLRARVETPGERGLLVVFWATWCDPCIEEIPELIALHSSEQKRVEILAVSLDAFLSGAEASVDKVAHFLEGTPVPYENVVFDGTQDELFTTFQMPGGIPYTIFYDPARQKTQRYSGRVGLEDLLAALDDSC